MMKYVLDAMKMQTREEAHKYLKEVLELPDYYGMNLDALHDCLQEMEEFEIDLMNYAEDNMYAGKILRVIRAAGGKVEII